MTYTAGNSGIKSPAVSTGAGLTSPPFASSNLPNVADIFGGPVEEPSEEEQPKDYVDKAGNRYEDIISYSVRDGETVVEEGGKKYIVNKMGQRIWSSRPISDGQYDDPMLVRRDPPISIVYNTSDKESLKALNDLQQGLIPGGPSIEIVYSDRQFHEGTFYVFVTYTPIWYRIPTQ